MRVKRIFILFVLAMMLLAQGTTSAREVRQGDQCIIGATQTIQGNLFALCRTLIIYGRVEGDLIGAATRSEINGTITGDVYLLSGQLDINGTIGGNLHFGGAVLRILPTAKFESDTSNLIGINLSTTLADGVTIPGSVTDVGYQLVLNGSVNKEVNFWGSALTVNGGIGDAVNATVGDPKSGISQLQTLLFPFSWDVNLINPGLTVGKQGSIQGNLQYSGPAAGVIDGNVNGVIQYKPIVTQPDLTQIIAEDEGAQRGWNVYATQALHEFITLAVVGLIVLVVLPRPLQSPIKNIQNRPLPSMGVGLLSFILAFPVVLIVILFLILGIIILLLLQLDGLLLSIVGATLLGAVVSAVGAFFFIAIFVGRVIVCLWAGRALVRAALGDDGSPRITYLSMILGIALLALLSPLPIVGWVINALAVFLGLGAVMIGAQAQVRLYRDIGPGMPLRVTTPILPSRPASARPFPPPIIDDTKQPVGMENLPEGFTWWED